MFTAAIAHLTNASQMKCPSLLHGHLGYCYAMAGRRDEALREISALNARGGAQYVSPVSFAAIYSRLGDPEQALAFLGQALESPGTSPPVKPRESEFR